jgi:hypothetical protein
MYQIASSFEFENNNKKSYEEINIEYIWEKEIDPHKLKVIVLKKTPLLDIFWPDNITLHQTEVDKLLSN